MAKPKPENPPVQMPLRVPPEVKANLEVLAEAGNISLNALCVEILERATNLAPLTIGEG